MDQQHRDSYAYIEYEYTGGKVLSGRALTTMADNLGRHYVNSLIRTKNDWFIEDESFTKQKYKFYNFQRKLPNSKSDAYRYQFVNGLILLASCGNYRATKQALEWAGMYEQLIFYKNVDTGEPLEEDELARRLNLKNEIPFWMKRVIEVSGLIQASGPD